MATETSNSRGSFAKEKKGLESFEDKVESPFQDKRTGQFTGQFTDPFMDKFTAKVDEFKESAYGTLRQADDAFREQVRNRPLLATGLALGLGFVLGTRWGRGISKTLVFSGSKAAARSLVGTAISAAGAAMAAKFAGEQFQ
jgi:hypothetical protein